MASVSSLLKSAETARKRQQEYEESVMAYEWQLSAKTYGDFQLYSKFLQERMERSADPIEALNYEKKINSARRSYVSNEIQRQTIDVLEGRSSNQNKMESMVNLYFQAIDNNDLDLAQNLRQQIDNLDLRLQQEAEAAQRLGEKMARLRAESIEDAVEILKGYAKELNDLFKEKGTKKFAEEMAAYAQELGVEPGDFFGMHLRIAEEINRVYDEALASDSDPGNQRKFQQAKNKFITERQIELPSTSGVMKVSYQDLVDQADAARTGQTLFRTVQTAEGTVFERNKETGFVWGRDAQGNYRMISVYSPNVDYTSTVYRTRVNSRGEVEYLSDKDVVAVRRKDGRVQGINGRSIEDADKLGYEELLAQSGFNVIGKSDGFITIATTPELAQQGIISETVRLYVTPDGRLQVVGQDDQLFNLDFDEVTGEFRGIKQDRPSPITLVSDNFSKEFIQNLDRSRVAPGVIGIVDTRLASTQVLEAAQFTREDIYNQQQLEALRLAQQEAMERARTQPAQMIQNSFAPQMPPRLEIQAPKISPQITTSPQQSMQIGGQGDLLGKNISNVGVARPSGSLSVGNARPSGTLRVR